MIREEAKELSPVLKAWAEGRIIQFRKKGTSEWVDFYEDDLRVSSAYYYRIKPEPKYRPFKSQEECWNEMLKHQPFGWIKNNDTQCLHNIGAIGRNNYGIEINNSILYFDLAFNKCNFTDGTPFGKEE